MHFWMYLVHICPFISLILIGYTTPNLKVFPSHWVILIPLHILYDFVNYGVTVHILGKPLYWFVTWQGPESFAICTLILVW